MSGPAILSGGDAVRRRAMFVLELVDPVTGASAGSLLQARAEGFRVPSMTRAGQFVWVDPEPPADRTVRVAAEAAGKEFARFEEVFAVPARQPDVPPALARRNLCPTGLYVPPPGLLAAAGMLIDAAPTRAPLAGAQIVLVLTAGTLGTELRSAFAAVTDERGGFVAVAVGLGADSPQPAPSPAPDGMVAGRLEATWQGTSRKADGLLLRRAQLNHLPAPLVWEDLTP